MSRERWWSGCRAVAGELGRCPVSSPLALLRSDGCVDPPLVTWREQGQKPAEVNRDPGAHGGDSGREKWVAFLEKLNAGREREEEGGLLQGGQQRGTLG